MALRRIPIRRVGNRHHTFMGGDREMVMLSGLIAFVLVFNAQDLRAAVLGILLWFAALYVFRRLAKADPLMRHVYLRSLRYRDYYPPRSTPFRVNTPSQARQYK